MNVAVVTPYYKEPPATLRRCLDSVVAQTHPDVRHYLVADGHPQTDITQTYPRVSCVDLPTAHADYGNTPRAVGALCALSDGVDVVCFLDADNLFEPDHVASVVATYEKGRAEGQPLDAVFAYRHVFLPGHPHLRLKVAEDLAHHHVDTSCISLTRSAAFLWPSWGLIPRGSAAICDRMMLALMRHYKLRMAWTGQHSVLYESNWAVHYRQAGLPVPTSGLHDHSLQNVRFDGLELFAHLRVKMGSVGPPAE